MLVRGGLLGNGRENENRSGPEEARNEKILHSVRMPPTFFGTEAYRKFDGVLAMYHDQGLAPSQDYRNGLRRQLSADFPTCAHRPTTARDSTSPDKAGPPTNLSDRQSIWPSIHSAHAGISMRAYANPRDASTSTKEKTT